MGQGDYNSRSALTLHNPGTMAEVNVKQDFVLIIPLKVTNFP